MKIAICISGQTRTFNQNRDTEGDDLKEFLEHLKHYNVDLYGVHWKSCRPVDRSKFDYKKIKVIDHDDVRKWVAEDFMNRCFRTMEGEIRITNPDFVEEGLNYSVRSYSQHWSAFECYNLIDDPHEYDWIIRWGWDNNLVNKDKEFLCERWHEKLDQYMTRIFDHTTYDDKFTLTQGEVKWNANMNIIEFDDIFFMHNSKALEQLQKTPFPILLERCIDHHAGNNHMRDHSLWNDVFQRTDIGNILVGLPHIVNIARRGNFSKQNTTTGV